MARYFLRSYSKKYEKDLLNCDLNDLDHLNVSLFDIVRPSGGGVSFFYSENRGALNKAELSYIFTCYSFKNASFSFVIARAASMEKKNKKLLPKQHSMKTAYIDGSSRHYDLSDLNRGETADLFVVLIEEMRNKNGKCCVNGDALYTMISNAINNNEVDFNFYSVKHMSTLIELEAICKSKQVASKKLDDRLSELINASTQNLNNVIKSHNLTSDSSSGWETE